MQSDEICQLGGSITEDESSNVDLCSHFVRMVGI